MNYELGMVGMVGQWNKLDNIILLKDSTLVVRWDGFEDTHYLDGLCSDSHNLGLWYGWSMEQAWL